MLALTAIAWAQVSEADVQSYEPPEYRGLVYHDGVDSIGRPVVVVNADALAPGASRKDAISYMQQRLEPIVVQVLPSCTVSPVDFGKTEGLLMRRLRLGINGHL